MPGTATCDRDTITVLGLQLGNTLKALFEQLSIAKVENIWL